MAAGIGGILLNVIAPGLPSMISAIGTVLERIIPDPKAREQATLELTRMANDKESALYLAYAEVAKGQMEVNATEAKSESLFVAGWRPFIGWVCGWGCVYGFILQPLLAWAMSILGVALSVQFPVPPPIMMEQLMGLLVGMLGIGGMRSYEKVSGVPDSTVKLLPKKS